MSWRDSAPADAVRRSCFTAWRDDLRGEAPDGGFAVRGAKGWFGYGAGRRAMDEALRAGATVDCGRCVTGRPLGAYFESIPPVVDMLALNEIGVLLRAPCARRLERRIYARAQEMAPNGIWTISIRGSILTTATHCGGLR
jgi:hypothetical protein